MPELVACLLPGGTEFVDELQRVWDAGDALLPVDRRLPAEAQQRLIEGMGATVVVDASGARSRRDGRPVEAGDALVVATSGSTGAPKGVVLTHEAVRANAEATSEFLEVDPSTDRWLSCLPLSHVGGLSVVFRALHTGTPLEVHGAFDAEAAMDAARRGVTLASFVPTAMQRVDASLFRKILVGGSAIPADRPPNAVATYGMTETGSGVVYDHLPLRDVEVRVVDGELQLRCPMLLRCYRDGSDPRTPDGWFPTGDAGAFEDGRVQVFGRRGDMIITGGENVWPVAVEKALAEVSTIAECVVVGRPDAEWGQIVTAVVVPAAGTDGPILEELRDQVKQQLPAFCAPRALELVDRLPINAMGKIRRHEV